MPALLKLHLAVFLFGLSGLFGRLLQLPASAVVLGRTVIAAFTLFCVLGFLKVSFHSYRTLIFKLLPSGVLLAVHWLSFFYSIQISSVAVGLLSFATFPIFVAIIEPWTQRKSIAARDLLLALVVFVGLAIVVPDYDFQNNIMRGSLFGVISGFTFALLTVLNRRIVANENALVLGLLQNFWAAVVLAPFFTPLLSIDSSQIGLLIFLGVACTALAHWLFIDCLRSVRSELASITAGLEPVYGILMAMTLLGEVPTLRELLGGLLILGAVAAGTLLENLPKC